MANKKYVGVILLLLIAPVACLVSLVRVFAQENLPQVTTACELKDGTLYAVVDGYSKKDSCKDGRMVSLGQAAIPGGQGAGNIAFIMSNEVLLKEARYGSFSIIRG